MKIMKNKFNLFVVFAIFFCFILMPDVKAASYDVYTVKYKCKVRTSPSDLVSAIKNGNDDVMVYQNQELDYIKTVKGPNNGKANQDWYAVKFDYAAREYTGYVAKACMYDTKTYSYSDDASFESSISGFPNSYKNYLRKLHAIHPNWSFKADNTNRDWEEVANLESEIGMSAIPKAYPSLRFTNSLYPNGIVVDGTTWYAPAKDAVKYYMEPRNFLTESNIFMYQSLKYNENEDGSVAEVLKGSFMEGTFLENGVKKSYKDAFIKAAKEAGVSSVHLASRAIQEVGMEGSKAVSGTVSGYEGYYNFYNIGATSGTNNYINGLAYAKNSGWDSIQKAITGGAKIIGSKYILKGQDTLYYQKFDVSSYRTNAANYLHQYQTNIMAPSSESNKIYSSYKANGKLNNNYVFVIPVYNNMPTSAFKVSKTDTIGGSTPVEEEKPNDDVQTIEPAKKITNAGYSLSGNYVTKLNYSFDVSIIKNNLLKQGGTINILNSAWGGKTSGVISTGDLIGVDNKYFEAVIYGDLNGDGIINLKDLLFMQKYLLGKQDLSGAYKKAADINKDSNISIKDLLFVQKYLLGVGSIEQ